MNLIAGWRLAKPGQITATRRGGPACPPSDPRRQLGDHGEDLAAAALKQQGYKILERNYRDALGRDRPRRPAGPGFGGGGGQDPEGVPLWQPPRGGTLTKQGRLRRLADYYLKAKRLTGSPVRFDVVAVTLAGMNPRWRLFRTHFEGWGRRRIQGERWPAWVMSPDFAHSQAELGGQLRSQAELGNEKQRLLR